MHEIALSGGLLVLLFIFLAAGVWVAFALILVGVAAIGIYSSAPIGPVFATTVWGASNSYSLAALPLFILMGEILLRTNLSRDLFTGLSPWLSRWPGRLLHVNVLGCAIFAAVSGSSAATAATIGKMTIPELTGRGYPRDLVLGTLAGSATLGLLIPPSIVLIVYGVATEQSIARLFIAGVLPGLMLMSIFALYVAFRAWRHPELIPNEAGGMSFGEKIRASGRLLPVVGVIVGVIASIYTGIASPTDAAAVGVLLSLLLAALTGGLTWGSFVDSVMSGTVTSCMIALILAGAAFLTVAMGFTGLPRDLAAWIGSLGLSPYMLLAALTVFYILLGCFLDGISIVVLTTSIIMPMIQAAHIDPLWFGIYLVLVVEMAQITPPVGFNLFVIQGLTGDNIIKIASASMPFFFLLMLAIVIITLVPTVVTLLPGLMGS